MKIIITGGTGLIGRSLAKSLLTDGHEVIILSRNPDNASEIPVGAEIVRWDAQTAEGWGHLVEGADAIVNLAGANIGGEAFFPPRWTDKKKELFRQSRIKAGKAVLQAIEAAENKPRVVIQSSAVGYYGQSGETRLSEDSPAGDDFQGVLCTEWEASTASVQTMGVRHVIARTGIVLSMEGGAFPRILLPFKLFAGGPYGNGRQWFPWIHIDDEIRALRFFIENESTSGAYNLSAENPVRNKELAQTIGKVMKRPAFMPVPGFVFRTLFGESAAVVLDGWQVYPDHLIAEGFTFQYSEVESAVRDLLAN